MLTALSGEGAASVDGSGANLYRPNGERSRSPLHNTRGTSGSGQPNGQPGELARCPETPKMDLFETARFVASLAGNTLGSDGMFARGFVI